MLPHRLRSIACLTLGLAACGDGSEAGLEEPVVTFERDQICLISDADTIPLTVEIAATRAQQAYGLMERDQLPADAGMLFTYEEPQPADRGFWMFRTRIPLDIAFIGPEGEIRSIQPMSPCASPDPAWCPTYPAGVEYSAALEVNQGLFRAHGIEVGDRVLAAEECGRS